MRVEDGTGKNGFVAATKGQALTTFSITEDEQQAATAAGKAYNINTGLIALTGTGTSGLVYFKNDEAPESGESDYVVTAIAVGVSTRSATVADLCEVTVLRNPTGGTLVDADTDCDMISNSNFGSSSSLTTTTKVLKATASGQTLTGGTDHSKLFMGDGRLFANLTIELPRGSSLGVEIDLNTSGGANVYCAIIGYRKDGNNKA